MTMSNPFQVIATALTYCYPIDSFLLAENTRKHHLFLHPFVHIFDQRYVMLFACKSLCNTHYSIIPTKVDKKLYLDLCFSVVAIVLLLV